MLWLGSPPHEELYQRVAALGRLGTTALEGAARSAGSKAVPLEIYFLVLAL